jgi:UDP:flavonoid glycosyltransferase YjiC (YdhE family)
VRWYLGAFGDAGHAFPMLALGCALRAAGHEVVLETWKRWRGDVEAAGMTFVAAPEYQVWPTRERPLKPYEAAVYAARTTASEIARVRPDAVVADILTPAPALAAELCSLPFATLVPHVHPHMPPGFPPYSIGARIPRTAVGRAFWRPWDRLVAIGLEQGRRDYNECRARLGLPPLPYVHTGLSRGLTMVATLPALEYPRDWPAWLRVVGPLMWEPPGERVEPPPGSGPVVLIAPSTAQDAENRLLRSALAGLADEPVRVIAIWTGREPAPPSPTPGNAVVVPWLSYAQTMPACDLVVSHGGHGTLVRALTTGRPVVICPAGGDMAENAARVDWAGVGVRLPRRFCTPTGIRLAVQRALSQPRLRQRAAELAAWSAANPAGPVAVAELERWAESTR